MALIPVVRGPKVLAKAMARRLQRGALLTLALFALPVAAAHATITVGNTNDAGSGSLRQAVLDAVPGETIVVPPGTYSLTSGELAITKNVTISGHGAGATIIRSAGAFRVLHTSGAASTIAISGVTIRDGRVVSSIARGGGVYNEGAALTLSDVRVTANKADSDGVSGGTGASIAWGGGINSDGGTLTLRRTQVTGNTASASGAAGFPSADPNTSTGKNGSIGDGGGLYVPSGGLTMTDSTVSGNTAAATGGPGFGSANGGPGSIARAGGAYIATGSQPVSVASSSFTGNVADASGGAPGSTGGVAGAGSIGQGGGLYLTSGSGVFPLTNVTIAANVARTSAGGIAEGGGVWASASGANKVRFTNATLTGNVATGVPGATGGNLRHLGVELRDTIISAGLAMAGKENCSAAATSLGHNLEDTTPSQCGLGAGTGDGIGVNPRLGSLGANGGFTPTVALLSASPAIDAGDASCPGTDQRGVTRPQGTACDIGAYEAAPGSAVTGQASAITPTSATLAGTATNPDPVAGTASFEYGLTAAYGQSSATQPVPPGTTNGPFSSGIAGLTPATTYHFRAVATNGAGTTFGADQTFVTAPAPPPPSPAPPSFAPPSPAPPLGAPVLSALSLTPSTFRAAASGPSAATSTRTTVSYRLSKVAKVLFRVERLTKGRRVGGVCVKATRANATRKACTRSVTLAGGFTRRSTAGPNRFRFTGRLNGRKLRPGSYRLRAVATDAAGKRSAPRLARFRIVKR